MPRSFNKTYETLQGSMAVGNQTNQSSGGGSQIQEEEKGGESPNKEVNLSPSGGMSNLPQFTLMSNPYQTSINLYI